eukprot:9554223-Alexandrium_andersonii.AAC.1
MPAEPTERHRPPPGKSGGSGNRDLDQQALELPSCPSPLTDGKLRMVDQGQPRRVRDFPHPVPGRGSPPRAR